MVKSRNINFIPKIVFTVILLSVLSGLVFFWFYLYSDYLENQCYKKVDSKIPYSENIQELVYDLTEEEKNSLGIKDLIPRRRYYEMKKCLVGID